MQISHSSRQGRWAWWRKRIRYYVPVFQWLPNYDLRHDAPADVMAGLAVACLLVPQALSYAALAKLQPMYGLYSSTMGLVVYAILGTSRYTPRRRICRLVLPDPRRIDHGDPNHGPVV